VVRKVIIVVQTNGITMPLRNTRSVTDCEKVI